MSRRKYQDYKKDPTVKTPILAWMSDRSIGYIALSLFSVLALLVIYSRGVEALERINTEPVEVSPYMEVEATNSPGLTWASETIKQQPPSVESWAVAETAKPQNIITPNTLNISSEKTSISLLATYVGTGSGVQTRAHVYGSGQAAKDFNRFVNLLSDRTNVETATNENGSSAKYENGFFVTMGDAIISVSAPNNEKRDELLEFYSKSMPETLKNSGCYDLTVTNDDALRSFFYDKDSYTGLLEHQKIETQVDIDGLPNPSPITIENINTPDLQQPESPIPADFPSLPEAEANKPTLPTEVETQDSFKKDAIYKVADTNGPGCGWKWSGQAAPVYDNNALETEKNKSIVDVQNDIDVQADNYVNSKKDWALQTALIMPKVNDWNSYVRNVNTVHERWNWLNDERAKLQEPWNQYVEDYKNWLSFDQRKADATEEYNEKLQVCIDKQDDLIAWEDEWGELWAKQEAAKDNPPEPSPAPTEPPEDEDPTNPGDEDTNPVEQPTTPPVDDETEEPVDIPEKPEGCNITPERPSIVDQAKPEEPQAPTIPEGVTIPDSWEKP